MFKSIAIGCLAAVFFPAAASADVFTLTHDSSLGPTLVHFSDTGQLLGTAFAGIESAEALAIGPDGRVYIANNILGGGSIRVIDGRTNAFVKTIAGSDAATPFPRQIYAIPQGLAVGPNGDVYGTSNAFNQYPNSVTGLLRLSNTTNRYASTVILRPATNFLDTYDVAFGPDNRAYLSATGGIYRSAAGVPEGELFVANGVNGTSGFNEIVFGPDGDLYAVAGRTVGTSFTNEVVKLDGDTGAFLGTIVPSLGTANRFNSIDFGPAGELLLTVNATGNDSIYRYNATTGAPLGVFATLPGQPVGRLAVGPVPEPATAMIAMAAGLLLRRRG